MSKRLKVTYLGMVLIAAMAGLATYQPEVASTIGGLGFALAGLASIYTGGESARPSGSQRFAWMKEKTE